MNPLSSLQSVIMAVVVAAGAVAVGYGAINSTQEGNWITLAGAVVALGLLIGNAIHAHGAVTAAARVQSSTVLSPGTLQRTDAPPAS